MLFFWTISYSSVVSGCGIFVLVVNQNASTDGEFLVSLGKCFKSTWLREEMGDSIVGILQGSLRRFYLLQGRI